MYEYANFATKLYIPLPLTNVVLRPSLIKRLIYIALAGLILGILLKKPKKIAREAESAVHLEASKIFV
jgi:hypothetical protein